MDWEGANWVHDGREDDSSSQVGRREDTDRGAVVTGQNSTMNGKRDLLDNLCSGGCDGTSSDPVFDHTEVTLSAGGQVSWEQIAEREVMVSPFQSHGFRQKVPCL